MLMVRVDGKVMELNITTIKNPKSHGEAEKLFLFFICVTKRAQRNLRNKIFVGKFCYAAKKIKNT